jgi:hypothetical protein
VVIDCEILTLEISLINYTKKLFFQLLLLQALITKIDFTIIISIALEN